MLGAVLTIAACAQSRASPAGDLRLRIVVDVQLPTVGSRFDYASLDTVRNRLFVAHLGAGQIIVINTGGPSVERTLDGVAGVHGVLAVPNLNRVYAAASDANQIVTYDATTLTEISRARAGAPPTVSRSIPSRTPSSSPTSRAPASPKSTR
jgi:hypothetical protein